MAVAVVGLVSAALLAITAAVVADFKRTHEAIAATQLRQLLLAGADDAADRVQGWAPDAPAHPPGTAWSTSLPPALSAEGASLRATVVRSATAAQQEGVVVVQIDAGWQGRRAEETLRFHQEAGRWRLTDVEVGGLR